MKTDWIYPRPIEFKSGSWESCDSDVVIVVPATLWTKEKAKLLRNWPRLNQSLSVFDAAFKKAPDEFHHFKFASALDQEVRIILWQSKPTMFAKKTFIRKSIGDLAKQKQNKDLSIDLSRLRKNEEVEVLGLLGALLEMAPFEPKVFGLRAKEQSTQDAAKDTAKDTEPPLRTVVFLMNKREKSQALVLQEGRAEGQANNLVRYLAELPANELNPANFVSFARDFAKQRKLSFSFLDQKELQKLNAGAFLAVIRSEDSAHGGIVKISYRPKRSAKKVVAVVGKGLCFDTGGYNIKTGHFMHGMHQDMIGAAVACAFVGLAAELELPYSVDAYLAVAENLISPTAYKPNEVVIASNGMSIEVVDTDAEGRMVLSDTLAIVSKVKPDLLLDLATLTGSVIRALDTQRCGVYSNDSKLARAAVDAGDEVGERLWHFPIGEDFNEKLKSQVADVLQCNVKPNADHIYAATFLSRFVAKGTPWVHIDLAAAHNPGGLALADTETTGFGPSLLKRFVSDNL